MFEIGSLRGDFWDGICEFVRGKICFMVSLFASSNWRWYASSGVCSNVLLSSVYDIADGSVGFGICFMLLLALPGLMPEICQ